jgi:chitosanase
MFGAVIAIVPIGALVLFVFSQAEHHGEVQGAFTSTAPIQATGLASARPSASPVPVVLPVVRPSLNDPGMKELANELVDTAENSTTQWWKQYGYIENIGDDRGYTAGLVGFCSGTGDMLEVVEHYTLVAPDNVLARYLPELERLNAAYVANGYDVNTASSDVSGLGPNFVSDWGRAADDSRFQEAQRWERDRLYFKPAVDLAISDGLHALGQFAYYDASVNIGSVLYSGFQGARLSAMKVAKTPAQGGDEAAYLRAFLGARMGLMRSGGYGSASRVEVQLQFLSESKLDLQLPLKFRMYTGDDYDITELPPSHG